MLRAYWLTTLGVLLIVGLVAWEPAFIALAALIFLAGGLARLWSRHSLDRLQYGRHLGEGRAFVGEQVPLTLSLLNRKLLPLPWVEVRDEFPEKLPPDGVHLAPASKPLVGLLVRSTSLGWYERVDWQYHLTCHERGYYQFGPATLRSSDLFGLFPREKPAVQRDHLVVYPRTVPLVALGLPAQRPFGERRGTERIFEDPGRIAGVRDYRPGDPLRRIDWKATARRQLLQSRVYEPSTTLHLITALNIATLEHTWEGYIPELLERAIVAAASVIRSAFEARYAVGLIANGSFPDADRPIKIPAGRDPDQLLKILEALAMIGPFMISPLEAMLDRESHTFPLGATLVLVTVRLPEELAAALIRIRDEGHQVMVLNCSDEEWGTDISGVPIYTAGRYLREFEARGL